MGNKSFKMNLAWKCFLIEKDKKPIQKVKEARHVC